MSPIVANNLPTLFPVENIILDTVDFSPQFCLVSVPFSNIWMDSRYLLVVFR